MAIDPTYQDNVVLKQEAFQNLLTNIKNYPIIDIDYIAETDTDDLHGETIWEHYTDGIPCIKITYGDESSTKGNIIFAENQKRYISERKRAISQAQTVLNELTKRRNRWETVYQENYAIYEDKDNQVQRFISNFDQIENNKTAFLIAGWDLLYLDLNALEVNAPYVIVPTDAVYDANTIYYTRSREYLFKRYEFTYTEGSNTITADVYSGIPSAYQAEMLADWHTKVANGELYTLDANDTGNHIVLTNQLGPELFEYKNILLNKNPYNLVYPGDSYDSNQTYYLRQGSSNTFNEYDGNHVNPSQANYAATEADWRAQVNQRKIYIKDDDTDVARTYNLSYTLLGDRRASLLSTLLSLKNHSSIQDDLEKQEVYQNFIDFITFYNVLVFLDTIGIAGYNADDIAILKEENGSASAIIDALAAENHLDDFNWKTQADAWNTDLQGYYHTFYDRIADIVDTIKEVTNKNLIYIRDQIRNLNYTIIEYNEEINEKQREIDEAWEEINTASAVKYDPVSDEAVYNSEREYYTFNGEDYIPYTDGPALWNNGVQKYVKNDRTMYGYKYVKVGSNIEFYDTYAISNVPFTVPTSQLEKTDTADNQASGTFRITINKHTYEVPIKGFGAISNQPITMSTGDDITLSTTNGDILLSTSNALDHNINFQGNLTGAGSIVTNNGNIFASGGSVAAACYQALRGYAEDSSMGTFVPDNSAGLWYDGSNNRLIRTWNISDDIDNIGLGCYQLVLISGDTEKATNNGTRLGIIGNGSTIEFHTGLPSDSYNTDNNLANLKTGSITIGTSGTSYSLNVNGQNLNDLGSSSDSTKFFRGDKVWSDTLTGTLTLSTEVSGRKHTNTTQPTTGNALFRANGNGYFDGNLKASRVFNAVFNDYAEYRTTINLEPGRVVIDQDDGSLKCANSRLLPGAQIISDTFGSSMGKTDTAQTPLAVAGRVLVYTYQLRENYHAGMAVCSAPNGTVDIMTREEIKEYPDCIVGIVSEIPQYEEWGTDKVKVNGRIWIKVK